MFKNYKFILAFKWYGWGNSSRYLCLLKYIFLKITISNSITRSKIELKSVIYQLDTGSDAKFQIIWQLDREQAAKLYGRTLAIRRFVIKNVVRDHQFSYVIEIILYMEIRYTERQLVLIHGHKWYFTILFFKKKFIFFKKYFLTI